MLFDELLPIYDVSDGVATVVNADVATTWEALMDVDLIDVGRKRPLVGVLGAIRILPDVLNQLVHGRMSASGPRRLRLRDLAGVPLDRGGWVLLGQRDRSEIALGLVGRFWQPVIEFAPVTSADEFRGFSQPGFAKTIYSLSVRPLDGGRTLLAGVNAHRDDRRTRTSVVPSLLDIRDWLGRPHPRQRASRRYPTDGRSQTRSTCCLNPSRALTQGRRSLWC
jgi:hypothetical protein